MSTPSRPDTFAALLGITVTRLGPGRTESAVTIGPDHLNPHGTAHGALLYSLAVAAGVFLLLQAAFRSWIRAALLFLSLPLARGELR